MSIGTVGGFFLLKVLVGLVLVVQSARALSVADFGAFSQLFLFLALLSTVSAGGVQNGLIRQVAASGNDLARERRSVAAAILIWAGFGATVLVVAILGAPALSELLVGSDRAVRLIPLIAASAVAAGGGQLLCAILTGRGSASLSLSLQALGLIVGGAACWSRLVAGDAQGAVMAYATGPIITFAAAVPLAWRWMPHAASSFSDLRIELRILLGFSGAFLLTATIMPATLFALRYAYRLNFGQDTLGYWLAANRVSDVTSQLLGLYMGQVYLPAATRAPTAIAVRQLALRTLLIGLGVVGLGTFVFMLFSPWLVRTFLAPSFIPAIPFIAGYLIGDTFRVATSLSLHTALARGRLALYVGTESAAAALTAFYVLLLIAAHRPESAYWGYIAAHGTMAALVWIGWQTGIWTRDARPSPIADNNAA